MNNSNRESVNSASIEHQVNAGTAAATVSEQATTAIRIECDSEAPVLQLSEQSHSINMEGNGGSAGLSASGDRRPVQRNLMSLLGDVTTRFGTQFERQTSFPGTSMHRPQRHIDHLRLSSNVNRARESQSTSYGQQNGSVGDFSNTAPQTPSGGSLRSWRMNLNDVLSLSSAPSTETLRSFFIHSGNFRYTPLSAVDNDTTASTDGSAGDSNNVHLRINQDSHSHTHPQQPPMGLRLNTRIPRSISLRDEGNNANSVVQSRSLSASNSILEEVVNGAAALQVNNAMPQETSDVTGANRQSNVGGVGGGSSDSMGVPHRHTAGAAHRNPPTQADIDDDNNVISDMFIKLLSHFMRYLPFICILFLKFIHDHFVGILDVAFLHVIMYLTDKSLRVQIAKFSQRKYGILFRDFILVLFVVVYRFILASSSPDPIGLLITPPMESVTIEVSSITKVGETVSESSASVSEVLSKYISQLTAKAQPSTHTNADTVTITKALSLGVLLYYVAVNDLVLKLITILIKNSVTMLPTQLVRHKSKARTYVLVEYLSQFYRALAPVHQWLMFLFESYSGLDVISGILFSSFYMGAKGFEFVERGKSLKKAFVNFIQNMDYERKPTKEELDTAGSLCPICHDSYTTPVVLQCGHIFCVDCVGTWFEREETCPMCRAKVSEDPTWKDGSTTFFYQLC